MNSYSEAMRTWYNGNGKEIILATSSPLKKEAFRKLGIDFESRSGIETVEDSDYSTAEEFVLKNAEKKVGNVKSEYDSGIVIGIDTAGFIDGIVFKEPSSIDDAYERIKMLSGRTFDLYTGIFMLDIDDGKEEKRVVVSEIEMREVQEWEIKKYLSQDLRFDTHTLGFDPLNHYSVSFIKSIKGSYTNLIYNVPLETIVEMLDEMIHK